MESLICQYCYKGWPTNRARLSHEFAMHEHNTKGIKSKEQGPVYTPPTDRQIDKIKEHLVVPYTEEELYPALLFRGAISPGRFKAIQNYFTAGMEIEAKSITEMAARAVDKWDISDLAHLTGIHYTGSYAAPTVIKPSLNAGIARLLATPSVVEPIPHLQDYLEYLRTQRGYYPKRLTPMSRWSPNARGRNQWRYKRFAPVRHRMVRADETEIALYWPFIPTGTAEEMEGVDLLRAVEAAVPRGIPFQIRDDLCQDLVVALLTGEVTLGNITDALPSFVKKTFKQYPMKYGPLSLDKPFGPDSAFSLGDLLHHKIESVGLCERCEKVTEDLKDNVCERCWEQLEKQVHEKYGRVIPGSQHTPRGHAFTQETDFASLTEDPDVVYGSFGDWRAESPVHEHLPQERKRMRADESEDFIVGPRPGRSKMGRLGKKRVDIGDQYVYPSASRREVIPKGDEWDGHEVSE